MASQKASSRRTVPTPPVLDEDTRILFEREYAGVKPLAGPVRVASGARLRPRARAPMAGLPTAHHAADHDEAPAMDVGPVAWAASGVQQKTAKALARGELGFDATCDLHGMTAELARQRLERVVDVSVRMGRRTLLVIVGRGLHSGPEGPVLPALVARALRSGPLAGQVLAFASADRAHGGRGALAVLLRRPGSGR